MEKLFLENHNIWSQPNKKYPRNPIYNI